MVREIDKVRVLEPVGRPERTRATTAERLGLKMPERTPRTAPELVWETPGTWEELESTDLRLANFRVPGEPDASCYLTVLGGDGGGLVANINRWRRQMELPEQTREEIAALPRKRLFDRAAVYVDIDGTWIGMGSGPGEPDYRLVGLALVDSENAKFLKLVGSKGVVTRELEAFEALAASFWEQPGGDPHASQAPASTSRADGLSWETPAGWHAGPHRPMRSITFHMGGGDEGGGDEGGGDESGGDETECYVAVLLGDGGGIAANINRWRDQMGQANLSKGELAALTRVPMLAGEGILVSIDGDYGGMGDQNVEGATLLGAVRLLPDRSVFVKLVGRSARVEAERESFMEFCRSLKEFE